MSFDEFVNDLSQIFVFNREAAHAMEQTFSRLSELPGGSFKVVSVSKSLKFS
jgi:hypothetical protein